MREKEADNCLRLRPIRIHIVVASRVEEKKRLSHMVHELKLEKRPCGVGKVVM